MEDATDVEETRDAKMETLKELKNNDTVLAHKIKNITTRKFKMKNVKRAAQQISSAELTKPQNGAKSDITRLQMECCEQKIKLHTTRYGNIVKESTQNLQTKNTTNADIYMALQNAAKLNLHKLGQDTDRHTCYQTYKHICKLHTRIHFSRLPCTSEEVKKWRC